MTHYTILLIAALACGTSKESPPASTEPIPTSPSASQPASAESKKAGDAVVMVPPGWDCSEEEFQPSERLIALTGGAVIRPGEAGHQLTCFLDDGKDAGAAYVFRYTIGDGMPIEERFQADLDETYASVLTLTKEGTALNKPAATQREGCRGLQVEHQVVSFGNVRTRRQVLCSRNGVAYNLVVSGTEGKAWTEAQSVLNSLTFK